MRPIVWSGGRTRLYDIGYIIKSWNGKWICETTYIVGNIHRKSQPRKYLFNIFKLCLQWPPVSVIKRMRFDLTILGTMAYPIRIRFGLTARNSMWTRLPAMMLLDEFVKWFKNKCWCVVFKYENSIYKMVFHLQIYLRCFVDTVNLGRESNFKHCSIISQIFFFTFNRFCYRFKSNI